MGTFFEDTMQGLLEAIEIEKNNIPLTERKEMPAPTFYVEEKEKELIDLMITLRKEQNISQSKLAEMTGTKQQVVSRVEKNENSPSLKSFCNMLNALGYELQIVKKSNVG